MLAVQAKPPVQSALVQQFATIHVAPPHVRRPAGQLPAHGVLFEMQVPVALHL
jgi:hypothetical protein